MSRRVNRYDDTHPGLSGLMSTGGLAAKAGPMALRGAVARFRFARASGPVFIGRGVRIRNPHLIHSAGRLVIEDYAEIQGLSRGGIHLGTEVSIGAGAQIRPTGYYSTDLGDGLVLGDRSSIGPDCFIGCWGQVTIGSDVMLAPGVRVFGDTHRFDDTSVTIKAQGVERQPVTIGDDCWIASGVTIVGGVTIGTGVVVGAGSVVTKDVPDSVVVAGNPARVVRARGTDK